MLPKGIPIIEKIALPFADISTMKENLEHQKFTGYIRLDFPKQSGFIFINDGVTTGMVEVEEPLVRAISQSRLLNRAKRKEVETSSYVLPSQMVSVLSVVYTFRPLHEEQEVRKKEFNKILETLENDNYTGFMKVVSPERNAFLLLEKGKLLTDNFNTDFGEILCGAEAVNQFLESVGKTAATVSVMAEKAEEIDAKKRAAREEMEKIKQLSVKLDTGFFKSGDIARIEENYFKEWGEKPGSNIQVEVETPTGILYKIKGTSGKRLGTSILLSEKMASKLKVAEGDVLSVNPARE